ncbi:unnamed protein product [Durusdinium trenchii]|uniref:Uncharacterized protein n=1 Tax=Durusdinium trenchii TaxID=1381693 RepID=A0ABP0R970_9DINO
MVRPNTEQKLDMAAGGSTRAGRGIGAEAPRKVQPFEGKHFFGGGVPHSPTLERAKDLHCSVIIWALGRLFGLFRKALDELVKSDEPHRRSRPQTAKLSRSDGPYARGANRGESRRRVPPEEKGLLKTQCFFEEKDLVIKLYDTEVLVIKEKTTKDDDDGSETQSLVLELTSGGFRTAETKAILNEALKPMALQVESENGATWQLRSEYKTPGQVTTDSSLQPFEDGMAVTVPAVVSLQMVKEKLVPGSTVRQARGVRDGVRGVPKRRKRRKSRSPSMAAAAGVGAARGDGDGLRERSPHHEMVARGALSFSEEHNDGVQGIGRRIHRMDGRIRRWGESRCSEHRRCRCEPPATSSGYGSHGPVVVSTELSLFLDFYGLSGRLGRRWKMEDARIWKTLPDFRCAKGSFVWATAHFCPSLFLRNVPHSETCFSFGSLYIFSQALGLVWMFLVVLLAVMSVRIVTLSMNKAVQHLSTEQHENDQYGDQPLRAVALCYVYYSVIRLIILFARSSKRSVWPTDGAVLGCWEARQRRGNFALVGDESRLGEEDLLHHDGGSMWTVAWELYHDFPTLRRMLLLEAEIARARAQTRETKVFITAGRASPRNDKDKGGSKDGEDAQSTHIRRQTRRRIVLVTPLLVLALGHLTLLLGQSYCICGDALPIFQPTAPWPEPGGGSEALRPLPLFTTECTPPADEGGVQRTTEAHLNRTIRFVLFVSQIQWFQVGGPGPGGPRSGGDPGDRAVRRRRLGLEEQAFTGLFIHWSTAIAQGKGLLPRRWEGLVSFTLLGLLMPCSSCRLFAWLVQPAGSGVVRRTLGGVPHHVADTALVTAWSWWSLAAVSVVMRPQLFGLSGFTLRSVSLDSRWRLLTTLFKYTLFFWMAVHFLRGCVAHGFAAAQTDLITISFMYPMFLCFVWTATFIAVSLSGLFRGLVPLLGALVAVPGILLLSRLLCGWVDRDQHVLLTTLTWLHLLRAGFRVSRYMGLWWKTSVPSAAVVEKGPLMGEGQCEGVDRGRFEAPPIEIKFAVNPAAWLGNRLGRADEGGVPGASEVGAEDSHKVLKTTYTVERRFGRIAARVLLLICGTFLLILCLGRKRGKRGEDGRVRKGLEDGDLEDLKRRSTRSPSLLRLETIQTPFSGDSNWRGWLVVSLQT